MQQQKPSVTKNLRTCDRVPAPNHRSNSENFTNSRTDERSRVGQIPLQSSGNVDLLHAPKHARSQRFHDTKPSLLASSDLTSAETSILDSHSSKHGVGLFVRGQSGLSSCGRALLSSSLLRTQTTPQAVTNQVARCTPNTPSGNSLDSVDEDGTSLNSSLPPCADLVPPSEDEEDAVCPSSYRSSIDRKNEISPQSSLTNDTTNISSRPKRIAPASMLFRQTFEKLCAEDKEAKACVNDVTQNNHQDSALQVPQQPETLRHIPNTHSQEEMTQTKQKRLVTQIKPEEFTFWLHQSFPAFQNGMHRSPSFPHKRFALDNPRDRKDRVRLYERVKSVPDLDLERL